MSSFINLIFTQGNFSCLRLLQSPLHKNTDYSEITFGNYLRLKAKRENYSSTTWKMSTGLAGNLWHCTAQHLAHGNVSIPVPQRCMCMCFISLTACRVFTIFDCMWFVTVCMHQRNIPGAPFFSAVGRFSTADFFCQTGWNMDPFRPLITTVMWLSCVCVLRRSKQACPFTPIPAPSSSFTQPPLQSFHIDSSARPVVAFAHRAAADRDKNQVYFPPKAFWDERLLTNHSRDNKNCQIEPNRGHC